MVGDITDVLQQGGVFSMLAHEIGRFSIERAAFHEAGHAVCVWASGGDVRAIQVQFDDGTSEWKGATDATGLAPAEQAAMHLAGGLAEARYSANVYDMSNWLIDDAISGPALIAQLSAMPMPQFVTCAFRDGIGGQKQLQFNTDIFSNDWHLAAQLAQQHALNINPVFGNSIARINDNKLWGVIVDVAKTFFLRPPRFLGWQYGYDNDVEKQKYKIGPIRDNVKQALGLK